MTTFTAFCQSPEGPGSRTAQPWESLPLFGTLEPDLFA